MASMTRADVLDRCATARAYLEIAVLARDGQTSGYLKAAGGNAVLAAIAASDALCGHAFGERPRGTDHRQAITMLGRVHPDGNELANSLRRCLDAKDASQYGTDFMSAAKVYQVIDHARRLVEAAESRTR